MTNATPFLQQRPERDALLPLRSGKIERRRRDRKTRRLYPKMACHKAIGDLIVSTAANAMDKLIRQEQAEKQGEGQGAGGDAKVVLTQPREQIGGGGIALQRDRK